MFNELLEVYGELVETREEIALAARQGLNESTIIAPNTAAVWAVSLKGVEDKLSALIQSAGGPEDALNADADSRADADPYTPPLPR